MKTAMFCTNCGAKIEPDAQFCISCGHPLTPVAGQGAAPDADDAAVDANVEGGGEADGTLAEAHAPLSEATSQAAAGGGADEHAALPAPGREVSSAENDPGVRSLSLEATDTADMADADRPTAILPQVGQAMADESETSPLSDSPAQTQAAVAVPVAHKMRRRTLIIWSTLIGLAVILVGAYLILKNTVFTPSGQINAYVSAVSSGDYQRANKLVDPGVANDSRVLLTNGYAKNAGSRIKNVEIGPLVRNAQAPGYQVQISYTVNGAKQSKMLYVQASGKQFLIFDSWRIITPLTTRIKVAAPKIVDDIEVNGINVKLSKAGMNKEVVTPPSDASSGSLDEVRYSSMDQYTLPVYPGVARVKLANAQYVQAQPVKINDPQTVAYIAPQATDALKKGILDQVQHHIDECTASTATKMAGCSFSNGGFNDYGDPAYTNIKRTVSTPPTLERLDLSAGEFQTGLIQTHIGYQYRFNENEDWKDDTTSASDYLTGSFTIGDDGELSVKFSDPGRYYY